MAYIDTENIPLHMPVPGTREPAQIALLNENCVVLSNHDHTNGKALAVGRMRSGVEANRPAAGGAGNVYFATDTGRFYVDTGTAWVGFITEGGQATVTGWTLIDPVIRDTLQFGPEGSGTIDNSITRTGANALRTDSNLGVGAAPAAWGASHRALQVGQVSALYDVAGYTQLCNNTYEDAGGSKALLNLPASKLLMNVGSSVIYTAPSVAAGAAQTFTARFQVAADGTTSINAASLQVGARTASPAANGHIQFWGDDGTEKWRWGMGGAAGSRDLYLFDAKRGYVTPLSVNATNGTVTLTPAAGQYALYLSAATETPVVANSTLRLWSANANVYVQAGGQTFGPATDNTHYCGYVGINRWISVASVNGTIQTSSADMKQDITPLDPAACATAVLETDWVSFSYLPPAPPEYVAPADIAYDEHDNNETKAEKAALRDEAEAAQKAAYAKMLVETQPARDQRGYVLGSPDHQTADLFGLSDRQSASPSSDLAVVACALQQALRDLADARTRITALEDASGQAPAA